MSCIFLLVTERRVRAFTNLPAVVIVSSKLDKNGVQKVTLSYTGTTKDAEVASKHSRKFMDDEDEPHSKIKDFTGSGVEHLPETPEVSSPTSQKKILVSK